MATVAEHKVEIRFAILGLLETRELAPLDLLRDLEKKGYSESEIKTALTQLMVEGELELTPHRQLKLAA